ncbi:hypothetical protein GCM10023354_00780 [Garicola koreensis]|uniref:DUF4244 domain-containing protein n=1 Tax=Garicola koreensis TaxID=1262554 RepID=UPI0031EB0774
MKDPTGRELATKASAGRPSAAEHLKRVHRQEEGLATAEYGIVMLAAVAFAGLLTAVLTSDTVRGWLESLVQQALNGS